MKHVPLTQGKFALVDDEDLDYINQWSWMYCSRGYAKRYGRKGEKPKVIYMHRVVNKTPKGLETDHINRNKLDNRKRNLRTCTAMQNQHNSIPRNGGYSKYKGVSLYKSTGEYFAQIKINKKRTYLGRFDKEEAAALAYNAAALKNFGEFAFVNVIQNQEDTE